MKHVYIAPRKHTWLSRSGDKGEEFHTVMNRCGSQVDFVADKGQFECRELQ